MRCVGVLHFRRMYVDIEGVFCFCIIGGFGGFLKNYFIYFILFFALFTSKVPQRDVQ